MRCRTARFLINRGLREALAGAEAFALEGHLAQCRSCRTEQEQLRQTEQLVEQARSTFQAAPPFPADFTRRLNSRRTPGSRPLLVALGIPASVAAVAGALFLLPRHERLSYHPTLSPSGRAHRSENKPAASLQAKEPGRSTPQLQATRRGTVARGPVRLAAAPGPVVVPDERYLNGELDSLQAVWDGSLHQPALPSAEPDEEREYIAVTVPPIAAADPSGVAAAVREQQKRAQQVDPRLQREVTLHLKAASLEELCAALQEQTRVELSATAGVRDEKVTILVTDMPARSVLRAVARLFGYVWGRSGGDGEYRYALTQTLSDRLGEEELRNRDTRAALLALDAQLAGFGPLAGLSREELQRRLPGASPEQKARIELLLKGAGWGGLQVYSHLAPRDLAQLRTGREVLFGLDGAQPDYQLPPSWKQPLLDGMRMELVSNEGPFDPTQKPGAYPTIGIKLNRSELGRLTLEANAGIFWHGDNGVGQGLTTTEVLSTAQSPSVAAPHNAELNRALRGQPAFTRAVSIRPKPTCTHGGPGGPRSLAGLTAEERLQALAAAAEKEARGERAGEVPAPHVTTADVWEAVHQATGMPVVADSYMRLYPREETVRERTTLFDALNGLGDTLGLRWKQDGGMLLGRSTSYFWDKLKEVPNRSLKRWREDADREAGLPLSDLLSMAASPDEQLDSAVVGQVVRHCWGLSEWGLPADPQSPTRELARLLAGLPPAALQGTLTETGLPCSELPPAAQRQLLGLAPAWLLNGVSLGALRVRVAYAPSGWSVWSGQVVATDGTRSQYLGNLPVAAGKTPAAALAAAVRLDPRATPGQLSKTTGFLNVVLLRPGGAPLEWGRPDATFTLPPQR